MRHAAAVRWWPSAMYKLDEKEDEEEEEKKKKTKRKNEEPKWGVVLTVQAH